MISVSLRAVGLMAPGLPGWRASQPVLRAEAPYQPAEPPPLKPDMLKPNERRRTTPTIKLALVVADDALQQVERPAELLSVFASSDGDLDIVNQICMALTREERPVSPTQFHNSVHNAPAGYFSIATGYRQASTSLAGQEGTFGAGLLEAAVEAVSEAKPVLLVAYDLPAPPPLNQLIPNHTHFGTALLLTSTTDTQGDRLATLRLQPDAETQQTQLQEPQLETLRSALPVARALPLLKALAQQEPSRLLLPYLAGLGLRVEVTPC
jgi:hypothetical protein